MTKIAIGCDHGAFKEKEFVKNYLKNKNYELIDFGTDNDESVDYPDYAFAVANAVASKDCNIGIVLCTSGIGVSIAANKVKGIRCALVYEAALAKITREHNDSNMLAIGAKYTKEDSILEIVEAWLTTPFSNESKHQRRIDKMTKYEQTK